MIYSMLKLRNLKVVITQLWTYSSENSPQHSTSKSR